MRLIRNALIIGIIFIYTTTPTSFAEEGQYDLPYEGGIYLSLNEALNLAIVNNFDIQLAHYDRLIKDTDVDSARSIFDAAISLTGDYNYDRNEQSSTILGSSAHTGGAGIGFTKKTITGTDIALNWQTTRSSSDSAFAIMNPNYESELEMKFTQPLLKNFFGMNDWGAVRIARIDVKNYRKEIVDRIEGDLADVEKAYWDVVVALESMEIRSKIHQEAVQFLNTNKEKYELGTSELGDLLAAEANMRVRSSEKDLQADKLGVAINKLKFEINHPTREEHILPLNTLEMGPKIPTFTDVIKRAFISRRDYKRAKDDIKAKGLNFNLKKNERWPELDLEGSLKLNGVERMPKAAAADSFTHSNPEYTAKVTLTIPFGDATGRSAYDKAKYEKAKALLELKKVEKEIVTDIDDAVRAAAVYKGKAEEAKRIEALQGEKLEEEKKQFGYGRSSSDRIIRFQEDYLNARINALTALREYKGAIIDLYLAEDRYLEIRSLIVR